ncbi:hypothetical protein KUCAC02_024157 [Chaenocephalus aceratus]|uniref:Uncharacterized protein n=1 Tax=Chaenocephalus aceratus TaxID=36190 RepID=A0ACB9WIH8_CHAAC|nr:hypothetical protein KUCAC02_024157 [Chaenocephalus aceratus]
MCRRLDSAKPLSSTVIGPDVHPSQQIAFGLDHIYYSEQYTGLAHPGPGPCSSWTRALLILDPGPAHPGPGPLLILDPGPAHPGPGPCSQGTDAALQVRPN